MASSLLEFVVDDEDPLSTGAVGIVPERGIVAIENHVEDFLEARKEMLDGNE